jgi:5-formyltetrahydrofolate cyclo-ligase
MTEASIKTQLRERVRDVLQAISADQHAALSSAMVNRLVNIPPFRAARTIFLFSPLRGEPALAEAMNVAVQWGAKAFSPRFNATSGQYEAAMCLSNERMVKGPFGTFEPDAGCPSIPLNQLDLVLVPGIAFDFAGRRLGRGKGFYDRLLAEVRGHKCGVAFDEQIVAEVPEEPHDVRVDSILTPSRWHLCSRAA